MNPIFTRGKERRRGKGKRQRVGEERGGKEVVEYTKGRIEERREKREGREGKREDRAERRKEKREEKWKGREIQEKKRNTVV